MRIGVVIGSGLLAVMVAGCTSADHSATKSPKVTLRANGDPVVGLSDEDVDYKKAVAEANSTLPPFIQRLSKTKGDEVFTVDAGIMNAKGTREYIWLDHLTYVRGELTDEPLDIPGKHADDVVTVDAKDVDDWMILSVKTGKQEGNFTAELMNHARMD